MEALVIRYGLVAVFFGVALEGEPFALAGGVLAHRGWLSPWVAAIAAISGSLFVDQFWFHLSRRFRRSRVVASVVARPAFARALALVEGHPVWFVLLFRFAYGLRSVAPVAIGASRVPSRLFAPLNLVSATIWGSLFTAAGYLAGPTFERLESRFGAGLTLVTLALSVMAFAFALRGRRK